MNAVSPITSSLSYTKLVSPASPAAPAAAPAPAVTFSLSAQAQKLLASVPPQPNNIIWGSGPSR